MALLRETNYKWGCRLGKYGLCHRAAKQKNNHSKKNCVENTVGTNLAIPKQTSGLLGVSTLITMDYKQNGYLQ